MARYDSRYDRLKHHLQNQAASRLPMNFSEVETIIEARLPKSAKLYRMWWSNNASNHVQAKAWLDAGYQTESVDMDAARLVFARIDSQRGVAETESEYVAGRKTSGQHPLIGSMKGTFAIEPGWDLTRPALDPEELEAMEANLDRTADMIEKGLSKRPR